jgi:hypothetical protein
VSQSLYRHLRPASHHTRLTTGGGGRGGIPAAAGIPSLDAAGGGSGGGGGGGIGGGGGGGKFIILSPRALFKMGAKSNSLCDSMDGFVVLVVSFLRSVSVSVSVS